MQEDVDRLGSSDEYVVRVWKHVFDLPGDQAEEAVNWVVKAFQWRREFQVDTISEETINMSVVNRGFLYSHNRDKVREKLLL